MESYKNESSEKTNAGLVDPKLEALYSQVPEYLDVLENVAEGKKQFLKDLYDRKLDTFGIHTSKVHAPDDVDVQAFTVALTSLGKPSEMVDKSYFTHGAHWIDDFIDDPSLVMDPERMMKERHDIKIALRGMSPIGDMGFVFAERSKQKEGVFKGLHRMLYGGLIQRSIDKQERYMLLDEYLNLSTKDLSPELGKDIRTIQPEAYLSTNSMVAEFINSPEDDYNFNAQEIWNLILAPAVYYHDNKEEKAVGESHFTPEEEPRLEEVIKMIDIGQKYVTKITDPRLLLRKKQVQFITTAFEKVLPQEILEKYQRLVSDVK